MTAEPNLRPLGLARAAFGLVFLLRTTPVLSVFDPAFLRGTNGWLGWPDGGSHVSALGLTLPAAIVGALVVLRTVAALALVLGFHTRYAGLLAGIAGYVVLAQDAFGYFHHLHMLYLGALLFAVTDADAAFSVRRQPAQSARSSLWLMRGFVISIYAWAAIGKLASEWGTGAALAAFRDSGALDRSLLGGLLDSPARCAAIEILIVVTELALAVGLAWSRTRRVTLVLAVVLHVGFEIVARVDTIGWQMGALLLLFIDTRPQPPARPPSTDRTSRR